MLNWRVLIMTFLVAITVIIKGCVSSHTDQCFRDTSCITDLGLIAGHLKVGEELLIQGTPIQAEPHFGHPVKELLSEVEGKIPRRGIQLTRENLEKLDLFVQRTPSNSSIKIMLHGDPGNENENGFYEDIIDLIKPGEQPLKDILKAIENILVAAEQHYEASVDESQEKKKNITNFIEYEDVRGFVFYADKIYQKLSSQIEEKNREAHQSIESSLTTLKSSLPLNPPKKCPDRSKPDLQCLQSIDEIKNLIKKISDQISSIDH